MTPGLKIIPRDAPVTPASCSINDQGKTTYLDAGPSCGAGGAYANSLNLGLTCVNKSTGAAATGCIAGPSEAQGKTPASSPVYYTTMVGGKTIFSEQLDLGTTLASSSSDGKMGVVNSTATNTPYQFGCTPQCTKAPPPTENVWVANWQHSA